jgi:hypothetical protein
VIFKRITCFQTHTVEPVHVHVSIFIQQQCPRNIIIIPGQNNNTAFPTAIQTDSGDIRTATATLG